MAIQSRRGNVLFERIANRVSKAAGSNAAFLHPVAKAIKEIEERDKEAGAGTTR